ncbi:GerMN domain-containing protein [Thalassobacillus hwangdonensis]|uniref:GerMN domain-containing protein n=1 Tax=Thalassobacillus hwangdonensis TaxID=546108 RepID=A0ABW3KZ93_9BACI
MKKRVIGPVIIGFSSIVLLTGCLFEGEQSLEEIDSPQDVEYVENDSNSPEADAEDTAEVTGEDTTENTSEEGAGEEVAIEETVKRQLFLMDANGMVVPQTVEIPKSDSKEVARQALEYLVKDGPVTELLPNGFQAVLPAGTQILGLNPEANGTLVVDVSKEFANYRPEDEQKILQAMTFTLTQFEGVDRIKLWINGYEKDVMPVNGTPISDGVSRSNGINVHPGDVGDLMDSKAVTLYYPAQTESQDFYYVPVTTMIENEGSDNYEAVVQALLKGPAFDLPLLNAFNDKAELEGVQFDEGVLSLSFNEALLSNFEKKSVSEHVMKSLVMTLTEQNGVDAIQVNVEGVDQVFSEDGTSYAEPVTRSDVTGVESF